MLIYLLVFSHEETAFGLNPFRAVALPILIVVVVIIGVAGYFLVKHVDRKIETTTYGGYSFPSCHQTLNTPVKP